MMPACTNQPPGSASFSLDPGKARSASRSNEPTVLASIYQEDTNIVIWQRELFEGLERSVADVLMLKQGFNMATKVTPQSTVSYINQALRSPTVTELSRDVAELVDMFCCLFGLKYAGLRLTALTAAMCPRFHVDNVPCRLVTTYQGVATEWLPHQCVDRSKLGAGNQGRPDSKSGLYTRSGDIEQLSIGDVALLKGELWEGNENAGLVHRSPAVPSGEIRLLLTLDMIR